MTYDSGYYKEYAERRAATEEEKQQLLDRLRANGKAWDADKKKIVELEWKPKDNEKYYCINSVLIAVCETWNSTLVDARRYAGGNCFRTYKEAEAMADKLKKVLKGE